MPKSQPLAQEEPDDDLDIFAGVGDYEGVDLGGSDDDDDQKPSLGDANREIEELPGVPLKKGNWFDEPSSPSPPPMPAPSTSKGKAPEEGPASDEETGPLRLVPLESSDIPSIREFLEMDAEAEKLEKRKARKEKNKGKGDGEGKKLTQEAKLNKDLQKCAFPCLLLA